MRSPKRNPCGPKNGLGKGWGATHTHLMKLRRRGFLGTVGAGALLGSLSPLAAPESFEMRRRVKLGISTYSYWHFRPPKVSIETVIEKASAFGVEGVDILHRQMDIPEKEDLSAAGRVYLQKLKRHAFTNGIVFGVISTSE